jgi:hypothetical protein
MKTAQLWFTVPQAVVLEATGELEAVQALIDDNPDLLVIKANRLLSAFTVIGLEADADEETRRDALQKFHEAKATRKADSRYLQALERVHERLVAGVTTKASRTPGGPGLDVDPAEFTRVELKGVDAIDKRTGTVSLHDLRINGYEYIESMIGRPIKWASGSSSDEELGIREAASQPIEKWDCLGDPLPKLIDWARSKWGDDLQKLPGRSELVRVFREQFGGIRGINENTMREVRRQLAPENARRGGAPTHRH